MTDTTSTPRWRDSLLPGELREAPDGRRSVRDWIVDGVMGLIALGVGLIVLWETWGSRGAALIALDLVLGVASFALLARRRARPDAVGALATAASICSGFAQGPALIASFNVALRGSRRGILTVVAISAIAIVVFPLLYPTQGSFLLNLFIGVLIVAVVFGWGQFVRIRRAHVLGLRERAARLQAEQRLRIDQARDAERRRIAREMHDVLAHRVSLLSLHAGALEFRPDAPPEEIAEAAGVIRATARAALEDLREVLGVLRDGPGESRPEPPQPTLADLPALVEESRAAGMRIKGALDLRDAEDVPAALGRTIYRVVQEGLTNARKHAPGAAVEVAVRGGDHDELVVEIVSRRPVGVAATVDELPGAGSGLIGVSERVALAGGALESGPDHAGDFVLRARLPRNS